tara:strand:- start:24812 stop:25213 length:402 start_codon:yes stop_codon:yes gene_type:complete
MRLKESHLRKVIRSILLEESEYYKNLKKRGAERGKIIRAAKDFSKVVIDQVETLVSGIDADFQPIEKRREAFITLDGELKNHMKDIEKEYEEKIRQPNLKRAAEENKASQKTTGVRSFSKLTPGSDLDYEDIW